MNERLLKYLNEIFIPYEDLQTVKELKEELLYDLREKLNDFKNQGYDDETAYHITIDSIGDIKEIIEGISIKTRELRQMARKDFSDTNLMGSDFKGVVLYDGKFNNSGLKGSDFSGSDLSNVCFDNLILSGTIFDESELEGTSFKNAVLRNVSFKQIDAKKIILDGTMIIFRFL